MAEGDADLIMMQLREEQLLAMHRSAEYIASLEAQLKTAREALEQAEACMSIVQPRSDTAEYLRILGVVRAALENANG